MAVLRALLALAAGALGAEGLQADLQELKPPRPTQAPRAHASKSVLILGCSVDRYAVEWFCGQYENFLRVACTDKKRDLAMGFVFHPGVGYNGDLEPPFFNRTRYGNITKSIIAGEDALFEHSLRMVGEQYPDMVVVDSSLWDLANWASIDRRDDPTPERLQKWCSHDMPNMLKQVQRTFKHSRVVFRTAPSVARFINMTVTGVNEFSDMGIKAMHHCVKMNTKGGKLLGKYPVIDYHKLMEGLMKKDKHKRLIKDSTLWLKDGYHPNKAPARGYINAILKLMDMPPVEEEDWNATSANPVAAKIPKMSAIKSSQLFAGAAGELGDYARHRKSYDP